MLFVFNIITMNISSVNNAEKLNFALDAWKLTSSGNIEIIELHLAVGETLDLHPNPLDVIFYVVHGKGEFFTENTKAQVNKGDCFPFEKKTLRGWCNTGQDILKLLVIKIQV